MLIRAYLFLPPTLTSLGGHPFKVLQSVSHRRRRGSAFSVRVVQYWSKPLVSVLTYPSVNIFKTSLENVSTEVFTLPPPPITPAHHPLQLSPLYAVQLPVLYIRILQARFGLLNHNDGFIARDKDP